MNGIELIEQRVRGFVEASGVTVNFNGKKIRQTPDLSKRRVFEELRVTEEFALAMDLELSEEGGRGIFYPQTDIDFRIPHVKLSQVAVSVLGRDRPGQSLLNQSMYLGMCN